MNLASLNKKNKLHLELDFKEHKTNIVDTLNCSLVK